MKLTVVKNDDFKNKILKIQPKLIHIHMRFKFIPLYVL